MAVNIDSGIVAVCVTVLLAILGLAAAWGALGQRVKQHEKDISDNRCEMDTFRKENRDDHRVIYDKLEEINKYIRNGRTNGG